MKYIGNVHGNEVIGREILLQLVKHLCTNYDEDPDIKGTKILQNLLKPINIFPDPLIL